MCAQFTWQWRDMILGLNAGGEDSCPQPSDLDGVCREICRPIEGDKRILHIRPCGLCFWRCIRDNKWKDTNILNSTQFNIREELSGILFQTSYRVG